MAILRNPNRGKFTVVDNYALRDENLSLKARGLKGGDALGRLVCVLPVVMTQPSRFNISLSPGNRAFLLI